MKYPLLSQRNTPTIESQKSLDFLPFLGGVSPNCGVEEESFALSRVAIRDNFRWVATASSANGVLGVAEVTRRG